MPDAPRRHFGNRHERRAGMIEAVVEATLVVQMVSLPKTQSV
jgi:hypothetical protein